MKQLIAADIVLPEQRHPCLFLNEEEVEKIRVLARDQGSEQYEHLRWLTDQAEEWFSLESPDLTPCVETGLKVRDLAVLHALTREQRYADEAARILLHYADNYADYPLGTITRIEQSSLDEGRWLVALSGAYDLIHSSGALSDGDRRHIEEDLLRPSARLLTTGPGDEEVHRVAGGICNYRVVENAGICAVGFLLRDRELIELALNSPRGFYRHLEEGVLDDGGWWEDATSYHGGMIMHFTMIAEAAWHSGVNLYDHPKYRAMFQWSNHMRLPDGTLPATNDAAYGRSWASSCGQERMALLCYARTGDRSLEPILARAHFGPISQNDFSFIDVYTLWISAKRPDAKPERKSVNLGGTGKAIFRTDPPAEDIDLILDYGPHAGYHGHYDKCNIILYANGRMQAPDPGIGGYGHPMAHGWYRTTLAHNTVVVNQRNQPPSTGYLHLFETSPRFKLADVSPVGERDENWGDQQQRRVVALVDEAFLIDIYRYGWIDIWPGSGPRDWVYHNFGTFQTDEPLVAQQGPLGEADGYQYVTNVRRGRAAGAAWSCTFGEDRQGVKLTMLSFPDLEIIAGDGLGVGDKANNAPGTMPLVIARSAADGPVTWKTLIEPFQGAPSIESFRELPVGRPDGNIVREEGLCLEIVRKGAFHYFLLAYPWGSKSFGDITFNGQTAYLKYDQTADPDREMPTYAFLATGAHLERGAFCLRTDRLTTLYLQRLEDGSYLMENVGTLAASVSLVGAQWTDHQVRPADGNAAPLGSDAASGDCALTFTLVPGVRYLLGR